MDASSYSASETLRDGTRVLIRALEPGDRQEMQDAVARMSMDSVVRRFFSVRREFTEREIAFFVEVDFVSHVALAVVVPSGAVEQIVAGARYVLMSPGVAEVAFAVTDAWQGRGLGKLLMKHLAAIAREAGLQELRAEVMPGNGSMLAVFKGSGLPTSTKTEGAVVHVRLLLSADPQRTPSTASTAPKVSP